MMTAHFAMLYLWLVRDFVSCLNTDSKHLTVVLGDSVTLNCTYNCTTGFVRGCWTERLARYSCGGTVVTGDPCTVSLRLSNVSRNVSYFCFTQNTGDTQFTVKEERSVSLRVLQPREPVWTVAPTTEMKNAVTVHSKNKEFQEGESTTLVLVGCIAVAVVLTTVGVFLCLNWKRKSGHSKGEPSVSRPGSTQPFAATHSLNMGLGNQGERVTLRIPTADDDESDTEVPYADIMITVRGVSTPELTQVSYSTPEEHDEWWRDVPRSHLQASRSADRLHILLPREVSRKMSTNSEYAVITYA